MSFQSSLKPMLIWMRCIGIYLESPDTKKPIGSYGWITSFGVFLFLLNVLRGAVAIGMLLNDLGDEKTWEMLKSKDFTSTKIWNHVIAATNHTFLTIGSHLSLICSAKVKWPSVVKILRKMEKETLYESKDYRAFRDIFIIGSTFIITALTIIVVIFTTTLLANQWTVTTCLLFIFESLFATYMVCGGVSFCCLGWMVCIQTTILSERVQQAGSYKIGDNRFDWNGEINKWRHDKYRLSTLIDKINKFFSPLLFVLVVHNSVVLINSSFQILMIFSEYPIKMNSLLINILILSLHICIFSTLVYVPHRLRESTVDFSKKLRALQLEQDPQNNVNFLVVEVLQSLPKITALELFEVNLHLIPKLAGTTLTYLIILCQFQFSEKD